VLLAAVVSTEQQQRRVVAAVQERAADLSRSVEALEVGSRATEVDGIGELGACGERRSIGSDVVGDELPEQRPSGGGLGCVVAALAAVAESAGAAEQKQGVVLSGECGQLGEEP